MSDATDAVEAYTTKQSLVIPREPEMIAAERALARAVATPLPAFTGTQMAAALIAYKELQTALDKSMPDQIMELDGRPFRKKGYWRAIAVAFNLTVEPIDDHREVQGTFADGRDNFGYIVTYRASAPSGRAAVGDGVCFAVEKARKFRCPHLEKPNTASKRTIHFPAEVCPDFDPAFHWKTLPSQATEHNVRTHAHTRAFNRAVSNLVGFGEVSAEEVDRDEIAQNGPMAPAPPDTVNRPPAPKGYVYIHKYWQEYEWHHVLLPDANGGKTYELKTKHPQNGAIASEAFQTGIPVQVEADKHGKWLNKIVLYKPPQTDAELDAEIAKQELSRQAGELL
jgi:hypothetical protein